MKRILYFAGYFGTIPIMLYVQYAFSRLNINVTRLNVNYEANYNDGAHSITITLYWNIYNGKQQCGVESVSNEYY